MSMLEVDTKGLKELQKGKPITFIINELCQNAFDENITFCKIYIKYNKEKQEITITVKDDCPEGFKDIKDAYTLFKHTSKRLDPEKRGRFNLAEKQIAVSTEKTVIKTTKGTIVLDPHNDERTISDDRSKVGSEVTVILKGTEQDQQKLLDHTMLLIVPSNIKFYVNDVLQSSKTVFKEFDATLITEFKQGDMLRLTRRKTRINLLQHSSGESYVYEMGIPVMVTDCPWHIDVQQKIPISIDRDVIKPFYLQDLYAEVLNNVYSVIPEDQISALWVRSGMKDDRIRKEAVQTVLEKRTGKSINEILVRTNDAHANEEAIIHGFGILSGPQMSREEWDQVKKYDLVQSTSDRFGENPFFKAKEVIPTDKQKAFAKFAKRFAKELLGITITVKFVKTDGLTNREADYYPPKRILRLNLSKLGDDFFDSLTWENLDLLIHEIAHDVERDEYHENGPHINHDYHKACTMLGGKGIMKAIQNKSFFEVK